MTCHAPVADASLAAPLAPGDEDRLVLVYDVELLRPACVMLQAVFGCGARPRALQCFDPKAWLISPTPGMRKIAGTLDEWRQIAKLKSPPKKA